MYMVAPARERGLKLHPTQSIMMSTMVAPARERGLKFIVAELYAATKGRSREGARIEIAIGVSSPITSREVAPARERGLK